MANNRYDCLVCRTLETSGFTSYYLTVHIKQVHKLELPVYCYLYLDKFSEWPLCQNLKCTKGENGGRAKVPFRKICDYSYGISGFRKYCSHSCANTVTQVEINKRPEVKERKGKELIIKMASMSEEKKIETVKRAQNTRNNNPIFQQNRREGLRKCRLNNIKFKESHEGRTYYEEILWKNIKFRVLDPISQDTRFFHSKGGGYKMDFSIPNLRLCIELDGWIHRKSKNDLRDKYLLEIHGWRTLRFSNEEVEYDVDLVVDIIIKYITYIS